MTKRILNIKLDSIKSGSKSTVYVKDKSGKLFEISSIKLGVVNGLHSPVIQSGKEVYAKQVVIP